MEEIKINNTITSRFSGATWFNLMKDTSATVIGVGGIGSYVTFLLSRLDINFIDIFDSDRVEEINLAGQLFSTINIGQYKTSSISTFINKYSNYYRVNSYTRFFNSDDFCRDITFCGLDNMGARKIAFYSWLQNDKGIFIDGRLSAEEYQIFAIKRDDAERIKEYQDNWLFSDSEADTTICSYKQTSFVAMNIASTMVNIFVNYIYNLAVNKDIRCVPFYTEFEGPILDYKNIEYKIGVSEITPTIIESELPTQVPELEPIDINTIHTTMPPIPAPSITPSIHNLDMPTLEDLLFIPVTENTVNSNNLYNPSPSLNEERLAESILDNVVDTESNSNDFTRISLDDTVGE